MSETKWFRFINIHNLSETERVRHTFSNLLSNTGRICNNICRKPESLDPVSATLFRKQRCSDPPLSRGRLGIPLSIFGGRQGASSRCLGIPLSTYHGRQESSSRCIFGEPRLPQTSVFPLPPHVASEGMGGKRKPTQC